MKDETMEITPDERSQTDFVKILTEHGYIFKGNELKMVHIITGDPYQFKSQGEYEFISQLVIKYVQQMMVNDFNMQEVWIPEDKSGPKCNIFISSNFLEADRCLIIIQGTGEVRAG